MQVFCLLVWLLSRDMNWVVLVVWQYLFRIRTRVQKLLSALTAMCPVIIGKFAGHSTESWFEWLTEFPLDVGV
jgi:hypothetical protein